MKIAFWSEQEKAGTTFNMAAVACASVMLYPVSVAVLSGSYEADDLEQHFYSSEYDATDWKHQLVAAEENNYFVPTGLDFLLRKSESTELTEQTIKANMKQVVEEQLYCLPAGKKQYENWWDKEVLFRNMKQLVHQMEEKFDVVFIDCGTRRDDFAVTMLKEADICVLNMRQEEELIGRYYKSRIQLKGKIFFLVGQYFQDALYNRTNLQRIYRMSEKELGAIPYNVQLQAAGMTGKSPGYVKSQLQQSGLEFEQELARTTRLIMQMAGIEMPED